MFDKKRINYQERIKSCSVGLKMMFKEGFDKMDLKEYKKYVNEISNNIVSLLKDNKEELSFYQLLVKTFNQVCEERNNLEQVLDKIANICNSISREDSICDIGKIHDIEEIIQKVKGDDK